MDQLFTITRLGLKEIQAASTMFSEPHTHDYEELLIGTEGEIEHFIDFRTKRIPAPYISFVAQGKIHKVTPVVIGNKGAAWLLKFRSEFIPETTFQLYSYYHDHADLQMQEGQCFNRIISLCEMMHGELQQEVPDLSIVRHLLSALFTMIEAERKKLQPDESGIWKSQNITFKNFLTILEENFRRPEGVEFYAEKLFMSSRNLNIICKNILQKSVSEIIETRKLIEAKNLLMHSEKTISEIGYELGYNEKSYFTNVFKKRTGQTPTEFREEMSRIVS